MAVMAAIPRAVAMDRRLWGLAGLGGRDSFGWVNVVCEEGLLLGRDGA
jgi:hypothetical protein